MIEIEIRQIVPIRPIEWRTIETECHTHLIVNTNANTVNWIEFRCRRWQWILCVFFSVDTKGSMLDHCLNVAFLNEYERILINWIASTVALCYQFVINSKIIISQIHILVIWEIDDYHRLNWTLTWLFIAFFLFCFNFKKFVLLISMRRQSDVSINWFKLTDKMPQK